MTPKAFVRRTLQVAVTLASLGALWFAAAAPIYQGTGLHW